MMKTNKSNSAGISSTKKSNEIKKGNIAKGVSDILGGTIEPLQNGLTIFASRDQHLIAYIRNAIELLIKNSSCELGIPMPDVNEVLYIYSGNTREMQQMSALHYANFQIETDVIDRVLELESNSGVNWASSEGQQLLFQHLEETDGVVTVSQNALGQIHPSQISGLHEIRRSAKEMGKCVVMILNVSEGHKANDLVSVCDDYFEVTACEPDMDCELAFVFDCFGLKYLNLLGVGKTMCNVDMSSGEIIHRYTPFIAADLETRAMWVMKQEKMTLEAIGKHFGGLHKSNVSKRLKGLPNPPLYEIDEGWLQRFLDATTNETSESEVIA